ncbi:MAG: hypothetical protein LBT05_10020 [Planctomycetaceae bacterium]|jgi:hypothetical protein|nr:hypothetical protein [Planctomycetaceae bacterium]
MKKRRLFSKSILFRISVFCVLTGITISALRANRLHQVCAQEEKQTKQTSQTKPLKRANSSGKLEQLKPKSSKVFADFIRELKTLCQESREQTLKRRQTASDFRNFDEELAIFRKSLGSSAPSWERYLKLSLLNITIKEDSPDVSLLDSAIEKLSPRRRDMQRPVFVRFREALEEQRGLILSPPKIQKQDSDEEITKFFDELPNLIESHLNAPDNSTTEEIAEAIAYLESHCRAEKLLARLRERFLKPNLWIQAKPSILSPVFQREINEPVTVNDNILGTAVRGSGQLTGNVDATFAESNDSAIIRVIMEGLLETKTVGSNGPVRVQSSNSSTTKTTKEIIISQNAITTTAAKTKAKLTSHVDNVNYTRDNFLVRTFAPGQIQERKPVTNAESERLTERRLNQRMDQAVDARVGKINQRWKELDSENESGESPLRVFIETLSTTENELNFRGVIGGRRQLTTSANAPTLKSDADVFVQIHQSLLDNAGTCELGGKTFAEEQALEELKKRFPKIAEKLIGDKSENEAALIITFANSPVNIAFNDETIIANIETTAIKRGDVSYPGLRFVFQFRIENENGKIRLVVKEQPEAFPIGFDTERDQLSVSETTIRAIVNKRLKKIAKEPIELKEFTIEGEDGAIALTPVHFSAKDGWLNVGLKLKAKK